MEDNYRKHFIENFRKRFDIDLENKMIDIYWFEVMEEKDKEIERLKEKLENVKNWVKKLRYGSDGAIDVGRAEVDILLEMLGVYEEYYNRTYTGPKTLDELWSDEE